MKIYSLIVEEEAKEEISDAFYWYEDKQEGLGGLLLDAFSECFLTIKQNPQQFTKRYQEMRHALVKKFPFVVIYEIENHDVVVYAVFHTSRNPETWKNR